MPISKKIGIAVIVIIVLCAIGQCANNGSNSSSSNNSNQQSIGQTTEEDSQQSLNGTTTSEAARLVSIEATYNDSTEAGTVINEDSDIDVVATYSDGSTEAVYTWDIQKKAKLKAGKTATVVIDYEGISTELNVKCTSMTKEQYISKCKSIAYKKLSRTPDKYEGEYIKFTGEVVQVMEDDDILALRVNVTQDSYGLWDDTVYVLYENKSGKRILEDDIVNIYGQYTGVYTYTTVMNAEVTIPSMLAQYVTIN